MKTTHKSNCTPSLGGWTFTPQEEWNIKQACKESVEYMKKYSAKGANVTRNIRNYKHYFIIDKP